MLDLTKLLLKTLLEVICKNYLQGLMASKQIEEEIIKGLIIYVTHVSLINTLCTQLKKKS